MDGGGLNDTKKRKEEYVRHERTIFEIAKAEGRRLIFEREQAVGTGAATQRWILQLVFQKRSIR